jgi:hypothetical protein
MGESKFTRRHSTVVRRKQKRRPLPDALGIFIELN